MDKTKRFIAYRLKRIFAPNEQNLRSQKRNTQRRHQQRNKIHSKVALKKILPEYCLR